jgi:hypothetical protein
VLGWVLVVGLAVSPRAEGDYLVPGNLRGYGLLVGTLVLVVGALATLPAPRRGGDPVHAGADDPGDRRVRT